ncbi:NAD(P)/FAD-dependent oxidoreductase [Pelagibius litoralis]|uniref:NAD(P)/FAD-dependent oxidoreductase n=1 Tax=Pelagibius litoralis TaxID=374515 RepID=A0A967K9L9_9PROT|nr:NAD(P)/FAD-dependent oxidoreductase [Pelagibius litoralis]NIA69389.1 NAD(P)/FAD-dependent oxidoreductase [Pelagibius litoralis]
MPSTVIVGAGPAGVRAAETLVQAGIRPTVIDEASISGGQIYRRPPSVFRRDPNALYGFEAKRAGDQHRTFDNLRDQVDYWPNAAVWSAQGRTLSVVTETGPKELRWDRLILATGAMDRVVPFAGWTLPGVYTLGGAQVALKYQACAIGEHPVFIGTGPLLYLAAYQYAAAGVDVRAVLDTAPFAAKCRALPGLMSGGRTFLKGLYYVLRLRARGIQLAAGIRPVAVNPGPDGTVSGVVWHDRRGREKRTACDALAAGFGLRSETQLADLCGVSFVFDPVQRQWLPSQDGEGRADIEGVYLAGDGAAVKGADAAELSGARAAHALLYDLGRAESARELKALNRRLARSERFRRSLEAGAFPFPADLAAGAADDLMICRCEAVTAGELRKSVCELKATELNRAKAFTRLGMGRCQGRVCGPAAAEILAESLGVPLEAVGRLRGQAPVKPVPMTAFLDGAVS